MLLLPRSCCPGDQPPDGAAHHCCCRHEEQPVTAAAWWCGPFSLVAAVATQKPVADAVAAAAWSGGAAEKGQHAPLVGKPFETVDSAAV